MDAPREDGADDSAARAVTHADGCDDCGAACVRIGVGQGVGIGQARRICEAAGLGEARRICEAARFRGAQARDLRGAGSIREEMIRAFTLALLMLGCHSKTAEPSNTVASAKPAGEMLKAGDAAPSVGKLDLAPYKGKSVVVYFYPKDDTPGCTKEACAFRDAWKKLAAANVQVIGVSVDDEESHKKFVEKYNLPFPLVADTDKSICAAYGVPLTMGHASRVSFLIGPDGKIKKVYPKVDPAVHADEILQDAA